MKIGVVSATSAARDNWARLIARGGHQLLWCATGGNEAVNLAASDTPEVILMDLAATHVPHDEAIRHIMRHNPCPILIATDSIERNCDVVFHAMGAGAVDAVATPDMDAAADAVLKKIALLGSLSKAVDRLQAFADVKSAYTAKTHEHLVVIGCSSGGPTALARLLSPLPNDYHSPIVVLQHIDQQFARHLAIWLGDKTALQVTIAKEGELLEAGRIYIAASGNHLVMNRESRLYYNVEPRETVYRPSVDVFFHSVAKYWSHPVTAVLLTGMGQDGAQGLLKLRGIGAYTIAQDEQTSAVYGMPKMAARLGAAMDILPIDKITEVLCDTAIETARRCKSRCAVLGERGG